MNFRLSFKVHSNLFVTGTRNIIEMPGLANFSADREMLKVTTLWDNKTIYIAKTYLTQSGWSDLSLVGDGANIVLVINNKTWTLVDGTQLGHNWVSGFNYSNYIKLSGAFPYHNSKWMIQAPFKLTDNTAYSTAFLATRNSNGYYVEISVSTAKKLQLIVRYQGYSSTGTITLTGNEDIPTNTFVIPRAIRDNDAANKLTLQHSLDGGSTWITDATYTSTYNTSFSNNYPATLGVWLYDDSYPYYMHGSLDLQNTIMTYGSDNTVFFNGATAVKDTDYSLSGSLKFQSENLYPRLNLGQLNTFANSWLVLKDIEALKL